MDLPIINSQPVEKQWLDPDGNLDIVSIWSTLQGEGPFAGQPAAFLRLAGCNLSSTCKSCDTDYTSGRHVTTIKQVLEEVEVVAPRRYGSKAGQRLVVITGGEPFRQNLTPLVLLLLRNNFQVQIETNGTYYLADFPYALTSVVCSPKTASINSQLRPYLRYLKYILTAGKVDPVDGLPTESLESGVRPARPSGDETMVYVQPLDEQDPVRNQIHLKAAAESCLRYGYSLSIQLHKLAGLE